MRIKTALSCLVVLALQSAQAEEPGVLGQRYTTMFFEGETRALYELMTPDLQKLLGDDTALHNYFMLMSAQLGPLLATEGVDVLASGDTVVYQRKDRYQNVAEPVLIVWSLSSDGLISAFDIRSAN